MADESEERYDIAFAGECLDGRDPTAVRTAVGALFKADEATLDRLFSGTRQRIKKNCDKGTALKYQKSLAKAGAKAIITRVSSESPDSNQSPASTTTSSTGSSTESNTKATTGASTSPAQDSDPSAADNTEPNTANTGESGFELLPGGSDILRPDERVPHEDAQVDLSHLTLAATGDRLSEATSESAPQVSAPDFDVAEPGARMGTENTEAPAATPDTSALDLAPAGADLADGDNHNVAVTAVSTDHLDLADAGSDLLTADERVVSDATAPDTSHIALDDLDEPLKT
ncbi:hypothetical protein R0137_12910 [Congregibacter brevis]|uniref:Uncharacterized protein n=1 Tax=Congregibacter brevis TaxID=3081201 RepID=A0ABZ0IAK9_9GAMM|nr:hypothetical protein R0137_12910 [Congregibacter sp. IMCC45268]